MAKANRNTKGKPLRPTDQPEAHVHDRAGLPADGREGSPATNTPRGSSGTAREASSADSGTQIDGSVVGVQPGSPNSDNREGGPVDGSEENSFDLASDEFAQRYPLMVAASLAVKETLPDDFRGTIVLRVTAKRDNFRRAGVSHSGTVDHPLDRFTADQIEQLFAEPHLLVSFVAVDPS